MRDKVKEGYDKGDYEGDYREGREVREKERELMESLFDGIPSESKILDLGCGTGLPFDRFLVEKDHQVTGVDISEKHVEMARENVPEADFLQGDFFENDFGENSFDAVVSFYAIFHIPREEHFDLFKKIREWISDEGAILITLGPDEMDDFEGEIGGQEMVWSSYSAEKNVELLEKAGFEIITTYTEDYREETHFWVLAEPVQ
ncbi:class I SAM-dependent methyltransferase [Candidatus Nanohalovita haloferacivicina]|uniref:class I SAM-dependent methyltransferase n=1 Tax=Candidatus Nanohalovita haloferacivicina TaxID=2978046 RepID=UPI00325FCEE2|nr:SAM-dependent methyltransferase [Candidatus Nanohalobia archaeon BNXNv]